MFRHRTWLRSATSAFAVLAAVAIAAPAAGQPAGEMVISADKIEWKPGPPFLPAGAQAAVLYGNPGKEGLFILRLKFPRGYKLPAHTHPYDENVTVISGTFHVGMGARLDENKGHALKAGGHARLPGNMPHYAWTSEEAVVQLQAIGPVVFNYVDPADDPRKKK